MVSNAPLFLALAPPHPTPLTSTAGQATNFAWCNIAVRDDQERAVVLASMNLWSNVVQAWYSIVFCECQRESGATEEHLLMPFVSPSPFHGRPSLSHGLDRHNRRRLPDRRDCTRHETPRL